MTILHEYVHYGQHKTGYKPLVPEEGKDWEKKTFGIVFEEITKFEAQQNKTKEYKNSAQYYLEDKGGGLLMQYLFFNNSNSENGEKKKSKNDPKTQY